jgi:predicted ribosome quality control (RQC) complex YloA/Tae2 family protein
LQKKEGRRSVEGMREIASVELHVVAMELKALEGMYLKKFYDLGNRSFRLAFSNKEGSAQIYCRLVKTINKSAFSEEMQGSTTFATAIRKRLAGMKLDAISQHGTDRILELSFSGKNEKHSLIIEMFGKGNVILVSNGVIELAYSSLEQKERTIKPGVQYAFPSASTGTYEEIDAEKVGRIVAEAGEEESIAIKALAKKLDAGPLYLEDALSKASIDPKASARLIKMHGDALKKSIAELLDYVKSPKPRAYSKDGKALDYAIGPIKKYEGLESREYPTMSELLDNYYMDERQQPNAVENQKLKEIEASIEKQKELIKSVEEEEKTYANAGKAIMSHMGEINEIIGFLKEHKNATLEEVMARFNNVKGLDLKNKRFTIALE